MLISFAYRRLTRKILSAVATIARHDVSSGAELLVLRHENAVLRRYVKKVCYRPEDRLWFAARSGLIPQRRWAEVFPVKPGSLLAWHRKLIADKYTTTPTRSGRQPPVHRSGPWSFEWPPTTRPGDTGVCRASRPGSAIRLRSRLVSTVWGILYDAGIDPVPRRSGPTWRQFLTAKAHGILAVDFVHIDTVLLKRFYALILIEHGSCRVHLLGISANPDGAWSTQAARNLLMDLGERASSCKFMIRDRGGQFTDAFDAVLADAGIRVMHPGRMRSASG